MSTKITIIKQYNKKLTIKKGCFNCDKWKSGKCHATDNHGNPIDVMKILTSPKEIKYRIGCCCYEYVPYKEKVQFT